MLKLLLKGSKEFPAERKRGLYTPFIGDVDSETAGLITLLSPVISRAMQKKYATGRPDQKDLNENLAATQGLAHMIIECNRLFEVESVIEMLQEFHAWMQYLLLFKFASSLTDFFFFHLILDTS